MTTRKRALLTILIISGLISCTPNYEKVFKENKDQFELNRSTLNSLVIDIEHKFVKNWNGQNDLTIQVDSLNGQTKKTLTNLGVGSIELTRNPNINCDKCYWITLNVVEGWNIGALRVVQIIYAPCDKNSEKNYHYFDGYHRDFWGQGKNWFIYSDTDFM